MTGLMRDEPSAMTPPTQATVIATHVSGTPFLDNLLRSFRGYDRYPIFVVINQYVPGQKAIFEAIVSRFPELPITLLTLEQNAFEFGGLYAAMTQTDVDEFFLLSHSCEIVDLGIFEVMFDTYRGRSVACFPGGKGDGIFWNAHIGKYRRPVLEAIDFARFMPRNIYEATVRSEFYFTMLYHHRDPSSVLLHPPGTSDVSFVEKYGRLRMRMAIPELLKWKTHWTIEMLFDDFPRGDRRGYLRARADDVLRKARRLVRRGLKKLRSVPALPKKFLPFGWGWHPNYYRWLWTRLREPALGGKPTRERMRFLRYSPAAVRFFSTAGETHLVTHDLDERSLVLDVGGFVGEWTQAIVERYGCRVMIFEPMPRYCREIARRFGDNPNVVVRECGLSDRSAEVRMQDSFMGSSVFGRNPQVAARMEDVADLFAELGDQQVDLIKINIEGGEYALLERMLEKDLLVRCRKIIVQFHDQYHRRRDAAAWRASIIARMEKTHVPVFQYPFVWEGWEARAASHESEGGQSI